MDEDSEKVTAYHEAGHTVMALLTDGRVRHLTISPDRDDDPAQFADASILWPRAELNQRQLAEAMICVSLAGPVEEMIYTGELCHPGMVAQWTKDWRSAWSAAGKSKVHELRRLRLLELGTKYLVPLTRKRNLGCDCELADNLLAHEWLDSEQISEIASQWL